MDSGSATDVLSTAVGARLLLTQTLSAVLGEGQGEVFFCSEKNSHGFAS